MVVGFGTALFLRVRYATLEQVDADLLGAAQVGVTRLQQSGSAKQLEIPEAYRHRFGRRTLSGFWDADGQVEIAYDDAPPDLQSARELPAIQGTRPFYQRSRGPFREVIVREPSDS